MLTHLTGVSGLCGKNLENRNPELKSEMAENLPNSFPPGVFAKICVPWFNVFPNLRPPTVVE